jgi:carbamoyltransferase
MIILGISAYYHDSAASLIKDGDILSAVQEERFTRIKHDSSFPINAINFCLNHNKININDVNFIVFYDKPFVKFERILETYLSYAPRGFVSFSKSIPIWVKEKLFQKNLLTKEIKRIDNKLNLKNKLLFSDHHLSHASSAFYPSPFIESAILVMDGVGEWSTTSIYIGNNNNIKKHKEINFPHSIGLLYSAFTFYIGFKVNSGEYKLMGLAPYGIPKYEKIIKNNLIAIKDDGSFKINLEYFDYCTGLKMTNNKFNKLFGKNPRKTEEKINQFHMDIAASIQKVTEEIIILIAKNIKNETNQKNLCLAGGVALNCVANGVLSKSNIFENIWIQPASGDAGGSLGAALAVNYMTKKIKRNVSNGQDSMKGSYLGPSYSNKEIEEALISNGVIYKKLDDENIIDITAREISKGAAVGWMQGKMEFGPRALGSRSIIGDPRDQNMQKNLNLKVKFRESFRPFAPSIIEEDVNEWFDLDTPSPYMLLVANVKEEKLIKVHKKYNNLFGIDKLNVSRSVIPAVTHVDCSARIQTVNKDTNFLYYKLLKKFKEITGCPILINTSFNVRGEPIVCDTNDAFRCFMGTDLDLLIIGNFIIYKKLQTKGLINNYKDKFDLD